MLSHTGLPIEKVIPEIRQTLEKLRCLVLEAPPGAGKTTIVPLALLDEKWLEGRRIVMLEPRRLAARAAAYRMSELLGVGVGDIIGYRTRLDTCVKTTTRIEVVTEGILTRFLQSDPSLEGIGCLIFDEFHERSVQADLGLALSLEAQSVFRDDLRILVMSATLDSREVSGLLGGAPVITSLGRTFPVEVRYLPESLKPSRTDWLTGPSFITRVVGSVLRALKEESGSVLVFLPGTSEIRRVEAGLKEGGLPADVDVTPLYGELSKEMQDCAIRPSSNGRRKVVLSTTIAETSITIEGIRVVIDAGLQRVARFSPSTGMSRLETVRVTKASAEQRRGRAGRLAPGVCVRLWSEAEHNTLREKTTPEIREADLTPLALELSVWGVKDPKELRWLDPPPGGVYSYSKEVLTRLGAIDTEGNITEHGREIAKLPLHPRLGHMAVKGKALGLGSLSCLISALLAERDIFKARPENRDSDIRHRLEVLTGAAHVSSQGLDRGLSERVKTTARQMQRLMDIKGRAENADGAGVLLAFAYPDRIAKRRTGAEPRYLLSNGRGAYFRAQEPIASEEYIVACDLDGADKESAVFLAAPINEAELLVHFAADIENAEDVFWDQSQRCVSARRQKRLWNLVLSDSQQQDPDKDKVLEAFLSGVAQKGLDILPWDKASESIKARINFLHSIGEGAFPELTQERLLENIKEWLGPWCSGMTRLEHLKKLDMKEVLLGTLKWDEMQTLDRLAPTHLAVPSSSRVPIDYTGEKPVLAVRLQEMFGLAETPRIANGKVKLLLHLLSPAGRPMQVTEDLAGFWAGSYAMVKKELKGRYPKHYWPDDPMEAEPTRGVKRRVRPD